MGISPVALLDTLLLDLDRYVKRDILSLPSPPPDLTIKEMAAYSISRAFLKKLRQKNSRVMDDAALSNFLRINSNCKGWSLPSLSSFQDLLLGELKRAIYKFWYEDGEPLVTSYYQLYENGACGPGAAVGARNGNFYAKLFASPLTRTASLGSSYESYISNYPEWSNAELIRREHHGSVNIVGGSRFSFVPKDRSISRCICIEPSLNMFVQLGLGRILTARLKDRLGIDLATQPEKNRELARFGSRGHDYVTCDLSSASDSMSLNMLKEVLPRDFYDLLVELRSPVSTIRGQDTTLHMVSTMGNGFTFPLQTMLFSCIVVAASRVAGVQVRYPRGKDLGNWGVFGDDIICPASSWSGVKSLLTLLGFEINPLKTFDQGPFRESCGHDYYHGVNVRGVYVKDLETPQNFCSLINQLNLFSMRTGLYLPRTVQHLLRKLGNRLMYVPVWEDDSSGVRVPESIALPRQYDRNNSIIYRRYEPVGLKYRIFDLVIRPPFKSKSLIYNSSGLLISSLAGYVESHKRAPYMGSIGVRSDFTRWTTKRAIAPNWCYSVTGCSVPADWNQRWNTAVYFNHFS